MPAVTPVNWMSMLQNSAPRSFWGHAFAGGFWVLPSTAGSHAVITCVVGPIGIWSPHPPGPAPEEYCWLVWKEPAPLFVVVHCENPPGVPPAQPSEVLQAPGCPVPSDCPWIHGKVSVLPNG